MDSVSFQPGDKVEVIDDRHQAYKKTGKVLKMEYNYLSVQLDPDKHGLVAFATSPPSYFEKIK